MKLYLAYGANTNFENMAARCPEARYVGNITLPGHRLVFRGVADVTAAKGKSVACALWAISPKDEESLDRFEGYPNLYLKRYFNIFLLGRRHRVMMYVMRTRRYEAQPSERYEATLRKGYADCGMDAAQIDQAIRDAKWWSAKHAPVQASYGSWADQKPDPEVEGDVDEEAAEQFMLSFYEQQNSEEK